MQKAVYYLPSYILLVRVEQMAMKQAIGAFGQIVIGFEKLGYRKSVAKLGAKQFGYSNIYGW